MTTTIRTKLQAIRDQQPNTIRAAVATEALDHEDPEAFFRDLLNHGCISGMVGSLTYYADTHAFFDQYYDEIEEMRQDFEAETGETLAINGDLKNHLAQVLPSKKPLG